MRCVLWGNRDGENHGKEDIIDYFPTQARLVEERQRSATDDWKVLE